MSFKENPFYLNIYVDQFNLSWECTEPYVSLIVYDESASDNKVNTLFMDHHRLDLGISGWMSRISEPSVLRLYPSWIVFLAFMLNCIDLKPAPGFLQSMMPKILQINWETVQNSSSRIQQI